MSRHVLVVLGAVVALLLGSGPARADDVAPWEPDGYSLERTEAYTIPDDDRCSPGQVWEWSGDGDIGVALIHVPCETAVSAAAVAFGQVLFQTRYPQEQALGVEFVGWSEADGIATRVWVQEDDIVVLLVSNPDQRTAFDVGAGMAPEVAAAFPGEPVAPVGDWSAVQGALVGAPIVVWLFLVLPARAVVRLMRPRYRADSTEPGWTDVSGAVRVVKRGRVRRKLGGWLLGLGAVLTVMGIANVVIGAVASGVVRAVIGSAMVAGGLALRRRFRPHPVETAGGVPSSRSPLAWCGLALSALAHALAVGVVLAIAVGSVASAIIPRSPVDWTALGEALLADPLNVTLLALVLAVLVRDAMLAVLLGMLVVLVAVAGIDVLGRRLRALSLREAIERDPRAPILFLRSFDEDRLTLPSTLLRRGLIDTLNVLRRRRFEEAIVVQLQRAGPVVAIAPPGSRLPTIGAARASYGHDEWQEKVTELAQRAGVVVLSGTPDSVREGFGWEIDLVAHRIDHGRLMVVVGPWRRQLARRWEAFRGYIAELPYFAGLTTPPLPDGLLVGAHSNHWSWHAWGATERTDISYAVAIDHALHALDPEIRAADPDPDAVDPLLAEPERA